MFWSSGEKPGVRPPKIKYFHNCLQNSRKKIYICSYPLKKYFPCAKPFSPNVSGKQAFLSENPSDLNSYIQGILGLYPLKRLSFLTTAYLFYIKLYFTFHFLIFIIFFKCMNIHLFCKTGCFSLDVFSFTVGVVTIRTHFLFYSISYVPIAWLISCGSEMRNSSFLFF